MKAAVASTDVPGSAEAGRDLASPSINKLGSPAQAIILFAAGLQLRGHCRSIIGR
jgi:hypothetical protein